MDMSWLKSQIFWIVVVVIIVIILIILLNNEKFKNSSSGKKLSGSSGNSNSGSGENGSSKSSESKKKEDDSVQKKAAELTMASQEMFVRDNQGNLQINNDNDEIEQKKIFEDFDELTESDILKAHLLTLKTDVKNGDILNKKLKNQICTFEEPMTTLHFNIKGKLNKKQSHTNIIEFFNNSRQKIGTVKIANDKMEAALNYDNITRDFYKKPNSSIIYFTFYNQTLYIDHVSVGKFSVNETIKYIRLNMSDYNEIQMIPSSDDLDQKYSIK
ncbi:Ca++ and Zn++ binding-like protein [Glossina pallidipes salivary gland hypertrophy virus]|uniref:Ca++ and Zn++ binding-like protein n=2 Tax=Glossina hytrovirus (isolate Glossina pallidipes/Ethiopia/Seibersdorf/-) TaxID=379529 RepID=A0A0Y0M3F7_GHVS|nr:hypothetical protein SGHV069 [Glossina pallidipes salivary gland hypertrophy virus]ABQ08842.1 hypothetical protein SGHV069 [Glossina pallidipes salivary gland hypertrophy virus]AMB48680.1 Ca++ and Zn++ binding-like protein [Glossina pallidipes salivary gland hypertrophy virus]